MDNGDQGLLTVPQLAERWKVKDSWVYQHIREIPHIKLGSLVRFDPRDLDQFLLKSKKGHHE